MPEQAVAPFDQQQSLLTKTLELLGQRVDKRQDVEQIMRETGLPYHWLVAMSKGEVKNPGVNRLQFLYEYLSGTELEL